MTDDATKKRLLSSASSCARADPKLHVRVKLFGVFKTAAGTQQLELEVYDGTSVRHLVRKLSEIIPRAEFGTYLIDAELKDPRPNALIMVSGTEIGALNGLDTTLKDGDEVVLLPVAHGGAADRPVSLCHSGSVNLSAHG